MVDRGIIDYHGVCTEGHKAKVGDTVIYALWAQFFVNRAYVAIVTGISRGEPKVEALFDCACNGLDHNFNPIPTSRVIDDIERVVTERHAAVAD